MALAAKQSANPIFILDAAHNKTSTVEVDGHRSLVGWIRRKIYLQRDSVNGFDARLQRLVRLRRWVFVLELLPQLGPLGLGVVDRAG